MLITCDNKGCMAMTDALYDEETGHVLCQACGKPIGNVSAAMKRTLKSFGQVVRKNKKVEALKSEKVEEASAERPKIQSGPKKKATKKTTRKKRGG